MSPHAVNSFVTDLVAMAQAMDKLPLVEAQLLDKSNEVVDWQRRYDELAASLEQSRSYAASIEQKLHNAEVARDDAELRFLELDEKAGKVIDKMLASANLLDEAMILLDPPIVQPDAPLVNDGPFNGVAVPIIEQGQSASSPTSASDAGIQPISNEQSQSLPFSASSESGQSEPLPTPATTPMEDSTGSVTSTATSTEPVTGKTEAPPFCGLRYYDFPSWVSHADWLAGGGTEENYNWRPSSINRI